MMRVKAGHGEAGREELTHSRENKKTRHVLPSLEAILSAMMQMMQQNRAARAQTPLCSQMTEREQEEEKLGQRSSMKSKQDKLSWKIKETQEEESVEKPNEVGCKKRRKETMEWQRRIYDAKKKIGIEKINIQQVLRRKPKQTQTRKEENSE